VEVWEKKKNMPQASVSTAFSSFSVLSQGFNNSVQTQIKCFHFLLNNTAKKKKKEST